MQGMWVLSLGGEHPPGKEMAIHSSILVWRNPWTEEPGGLQPMGLERVRHNWTTKQQQQGTRLHMLQLKPSAARINTFYIKNSITSFFKKEGCYVPAFCGLQCFRICRSLPWIPQWAGRCWPKGEAWRPGFTWDLVQEIKELKGENEGHSLLFFWHVFYWRRCINGSVNLWRRGVKSKERITEEPSKNLFWCCFRMWSHEYFLLYTRRVDSLLFPCCWNDVEGFKELSHLKAFPNIFLHYVLTKAVLALCLFFNSHILMC